MVNDEEIIMITKHIFRSLERNKMMHYLFLYYNE